MVEHKYLQSEPRSEAFDFPCVWDMFGELGECIWDMLGTCSGGLGGYLELSVDSMWALQQQHMNKTKSERKSPSST